MNYGLLITMLLVSACSKNVAPPARHDLGVAAAPKNLASAAQIVVTAPDWMNGQHIHYRLLYSSASQVRSYNLDRWLAPPPELLRQRFLSDGINHNVPLEIELLEFEQQFSSTLLAQASLRLVVRAYSPVEHRLIAGRHFSLKKACPSADAKGGVAALADLVKAASSQIGIWLASLE